MNDGQGLPTEPLAAPAQPKPAAKAQPQRVNRPRDAKGRLVSAKAPKPEPAPTRGRPADGRQDEASEEDGYIDAGLSRRSLAEGEGNSFEIPDHLVKRGWVYQWQALSVVGQPSDPSEMGFASRQGWIPCKDPAIRKHFCAPGWEKPTIEIGAMMLMTRPKRLNDEAAREMREKADRQKRDKLQQALAAPMEQSPLMPRHVDTMQVEGEMGAYATDPRRARSA